MADLLGGIWSLQCGRVFCRHRPLLVPILLHWEGKLLVLVCVSICLYKCVQTLIYNAKKKNTICIYIPLWTGSCNLGTRGLGFSVEPSSCKGMVQHVGSSNGNWESKQQPWGFRQLHHYHPHINPEFGRIAIV